LHRIPQELSLFQRLSKVLLKTVAALVLLFAIAVAALFLILSLEHRSALTLPVPSGRFPVGRSSFHYLLPLPTLHPGSSRELMLWLWYPAASNSAPPAEYLPAAWRNADAQHSGILLSKFLTHDLAKVRAHSTADPPISPEQPSYPVVILRAGGGAFTTDFTTLAEDLASHGYIVVGFDAPYRTILFVTSDGQIIERPPSSNPENLSPQAAEHLANTLLPQWVADTETVADYLRALQPGQAAGHLSGHLDLQHLGMFGHSFGGATSLQFCHDDSRCQAAIDIDGAPFGSVVQDGLRQPTMFLLSDHSREMSDPTSREIAANLHSIYDRLPHGRLFVTLTGANHFTFSDQILLKSQHLIRALQIAGPFGHLDPQRGLVIATAYIHTFFDVYLKGASASQLTSLSSQFPEVHPEP
jgi:dienelactone hydrolase